MDNVVANPVSSCVRESEGDQMNLKQDHTEVAHIESVLCVSLALSPVP